MDTARSEPQPPVVDDRVATDLPCLSCGYNLRTLRSDGRCPECGADVADTVAVRLSLMSARDWTRTLGRGLNLLAIWLVAAAVSAVGLAALALAPTSIVALGPTASVLMLAWGTAVGVVVLAGPICVLQLGAAPPARLPLARRLPWRRVGRWCLGATVVAVAALAVVDAGRASQAAWIGLVLGAAAVSAPLPLLVALHLVSVARLFGLPSRAAGVDRLAVLAIAPMTITAALPLQVLRVFGGSPVLPAVLMVVLAAWAIECARRVVRLARCLRRWPETGERVSQSTSCRSEC